MVIPDTFGTRGERFIQSFNFTDISDGIATQTYYPATTKAQTTTSYIMTSENSTYSNDEQTSYAIPKMNDGTYRKDKDIDFDLTEFQLSKTFKDEGSIQVTWGCSQAYTANSNGVYIICKLRKWDGTTETEIASVQSETWNDGKGTALKTSLLPITIPQTHFKKGEILRLTIEMWSMLDSSIANGTAYLKHDPVDRNGSATNPSVLKLNMPSKLNL